jgi:hypothetical protein
MRGLLNNYNTIPRWCWEDTNDEIVDGYPEETWSYSDNIAFVPSWQRIDETRDDKRN